MGSASGNTNYGGFDSFVTKFDNSGTEQWTRQLGSTNHEGGYGVTVDFSGNAYVVGATWDSFWDASRTTWASLYVILGNTRPF